MSEKIKPEPTENDRLIDLTQKGSPFLKGLKKPIRTVEYTVGQLTFKAPRGAGDPTPDNVAQYGGIYVNKDTGATGEKVEDVI